VKSFVEGGGASQLQRRSCCRVNCLHSLHASALRREVKPWRALTMRARQSP
jgi:hypothetical protein